MLTCKMVSDLQECYSPFSHYFSDDISPNQLVDDSSNIKQITQLVTSTIQNKQSHSILLYGQRGFGRKSAIRKSIDNYEQQFSQKKLIKIFVNAFQHNNELSIINAIQSQLKMVQQYKTNISKLSAQQLQQFFSQFEQKSNGLILIIENVEILATVKKQFFLYSILEWVRDSKFPIIFAGITCDLQFQEKLEKRVKSRFQNTPFYFMELDIKFMKQILLSRLDLIDRNQVINLYEQYIQSNAFQEYFNKLLQLQISISKQLNLFKASLYKAIVHFERSQENIHIQELMELSEPFIFPNKNQELESILDYPEFIVLFSLYNLIIKQQPQIMFDDIIQHIEKSRQTYKVQKHVTINEFSPQVLNKALDSLIRSNIIQLQQQTKNLENNQLILKLSIDQVKKLIIYASENLNDYISYLVSFGI